MAPIDSNTQLAAPAGRIAHDRRTQKQKRGRLIVSAFSAAIDTAAHSFLSSIDLYGVADASLRRAARVIFATIVEAAHLYHQYLMFILA